MANSCSASNRFDDYSWDAGQGHAYRIWARAGETITVTLTTSYACSGTSADAATTPDAAVSLWNATWKLYQGSDCGIVTGGGDQWCRRLVGSGAQPYTPPRDGWIAVVVEGSTAFDEEGDYTLRLRLSGCVGASCECP